MADRTTKQMGWLEFAQTLWAIHELLEFAKKQIPEAQYALSRGIEAPVWLREHLVTKARALYQFVAQFDDAVDEPVKVIERVLFQTRSDGTFLVAGVYEDKPYVMLFTAFENQGSYYAVDADGTLWYMAMNIDNSPDFETWGTVDCFDTGDDAEDETRLKEINDFFKTSFTVNSFPGR